MLILLFSLSMLSSCDDVSGEPHVNTSTLYFDAKGGEQYVKIKIKKISWTFSGLSIHPFPHTKLTEDNNKDGTIKKEKIQISTLSDGRQRIHYDWITFIVSKDKRYIRVLVEKNNTKKRGIYFEAVGRIIDGGSFIVFQSEK